jgi:hypothetical protein
MDNKILGGVLSALGVLGALLGVYLFQISADPPHPKRLILALVLGVIFLASGLVLGLRPTGGATKTQA